MRLAAIALIACALLRASRADAQRREPAGTDKGDTIPNARVVLVPANEGYNIARLDAAVKNFKVLGVYATEVAIARSLATKVGAGVGAPVQPLARAARSADAFAVAISDSLVEKLARANMKHAIVLVADTDLVRPILGDVFKDLVKRSRGDRALDTLEPAGTYTIFVRANNTRLLAYRP